MLATVVVNRHHLKPGWEQNPYYKYIGRGSKLGNQWSHLADTLAKYKVETREDSILQYEWNPREGIRARLLFGEPGLREVILSCEGHGLVCYCHPRACHGDVIVRLIQEIRERKL